MKLTEAEWMTLAERLNEGLDVPEDARAAWLESLTGFDPGLKSVLRDLLRKHARGGGGLPDTLPKLMDAAEAVVGSPAGRPMPAAIGRYHILSLIGAGGMGAVYQAEQEQPRRTVALKVVKPGLTAPEVLRRFEHESDSLARLQHPGIAQIYEAGIADTGFGPQPWLAMEFIRGLSLLDFAKARRLSTNQRLEILSRTCEAVHHAHLRGIIHRDLKPANILVDESGQPKIVDFGVARITDGDVASARETRFGDLVGTLAYMSPEQVLADPMELDARSDVYTLGLLLYELLAGRLPYRVTGNLPQAIRIIREETPAPLGTVHRSFRGDLETVVMKALAKDKTRRYGSAADLAADLRRYLTNDPIQARPPSATYQVRKFAARHKRLAGAVVAVFVALVAGLLATGWQMTRANRERDRAAAAERSATQNRDRALQAERVADGERVRAQQERDRALQEASRADTQSAAAKAVSDFLQTDLLALAGPRAQVDPKTRFDPDLKVRTVLDRAAARIAGKFEAQPLVEASIRQTVGSAYGDLGLLAEAQRQMERALDLRRRALGPEHPDTVSSIYALGDLYVRARKFGPAEALLNKALEARRRLRGDRDPDTLAAMGSLATVAAMVQGDYARTAAILTRILEVQRSALGDEHPDTLAVMNNLAAQYVNQGKYDEAEDLDKRVLDVKRRVMGEEHPSTLTTMSNLGVVNRYQGKYAQSETLLTAALQMTRRVLGGEHRETLKVLRSLALLYHAEGKYSQASPLLSEVLEVGRRVLGDQHLDTLAAMNNMAELYRRQKKYAEAESMFGELLAVRRRSLAADHPNITNVLISLGGMRLEQGRYTEAEPLLREALDGQRKASPDTWRRYYTESLMGVCLTGLGQYAEAEPILISGYKGVLARQNSMPFENREVLLELKASIGQLYREWGKAPPAI
ncbi:MAG TPA: serine/threonine-protein kinase [Bryobacteraceae bacterium]|nr:serine/threonine-protein kinase [Bryobacteraceae bacterium]